MKKAHCDSVIDWKKDDSCSSDVSTATIDIISNYFELMLSGLVIRIHNKSQAKIKMSRFLKVDECFIFRSDMYFG